MLAGSCWQCEVPSVVQTFTGSVMADLRQPGPAEISVPP